MDLLGSTGLRLRNRQPDISLYCEITHTDTGLVHYVVCLFTSQPKLGPQRNERLSRPRQIHSTYFLIDAKDESRSKITMNMYVLIQNVDCNEKTH